MAKNQPFQNALANLKAGVQNKLQPNCTGIEMGGGTLRACNTCDAVEYYLYLVTLYLSINFIINLLHILSCHRLG